MRWFFLAAVIAWTSSGVAGCGGDCSQSADIQVTVAPNGDVVTGTIVRLHVMLSVADGPTKVLDITPSHALSSGGSAFILRPDPAPADKYDVSMTVQAFDASNALIAIGSESMTAITSGCNRLTVHLAALPGGTPSDGGGGVVVGDMGDMGGVLPPDMAGCIGGTPDEDSDGRANSCDACPADSDPSPMDSDGDGLPDACDPDPGTGTNRLLYFEPFDSDSGHWSGSNPVMQSYLNLDPGMPGIALSNNTVDSLPLNVRVQALVFPKGYYTGANPIDTGIFVGTNPNPGAPGTSGALCRLNGSNNTLEVLPVQNGILQSGSSQQFMISANLFRLRLTQRGNKWTCEAQVNNNTATVMTMQGVTAPLYMSLRAENMFVNFHSVVAETALP